jgi:hypothetical protein
MENIFNIKNYNYKHLKKSSEHNSELTDILSHRVCK